MAEAERGTQPIQRRLAAFNATMVGGLIAVFVSIPLTSPDDRIANTGSVAVLSLVAALILGRIWSMLSGDLRTRTRSFSRVCTALFIVVVGAALVIENVGELSNTARYVLPLTAAECVAAAALSPVFESTVRGARLVWSGVALAVGVVAIGVVLAVLEVGFKEAPNLTLPPAP